MCRRKGSGGEDDKEVERRHMTENAGTDSTMSNTLCDCNLQYLSANSSPETCGHHHDPFCHLQYAYNRSHKAVLERYVHELSLIHIQFIASQTCNRPSFHGNITSIQVMHSVLIASRADLREVTQPSAAARWAGSSDCRPLSNDRTRSLLHREAISC